MRSVKIKFLIVSIVSTLFFQLSPAISAVTATWSIINVKDGTKPIELSLAGVPAVTNPFDPA
jgi:hypothetical protein